MLYQILFFFSPFSSMKYWFYFWINRLYVYITKVMTLWYHIFNTYYIDYFKNQSYKTCFYKYHISYRGKSRAHFNFIVLKHSYHGFYNIWLLISLCAQMECISICWRHLVTTKESSNPIFFSEKDLVDIVGAQREMCNHLK